MDWFYAAISASGSSVITALITAYLLKRQLEADARERKKLSDKVEQLETQKLKKLEDSIEKHIKDDVSQQIMTEIKGLTAAVSKMTDCTLRMIEDNGRQTGQIEGLKREIDKMSR